MCPCGSKYQDRSGDNDCVKYFDCPIFAAFRDLKEEKGWLKISQNKDLDHIIQGSVDALRNYKEGNVVGKLLHDQAILILQQILKFKNIELSVQEIEKSDDFKLFSECLSEKWEEETKKYSKKFTMLFNPILMANKKIQEACEEDNICKFYEVLTRNKQGFKKNIGRAIPDVCQIVIDNLSDIKLKSKEFCRSHHCKFLKTLLRDESHLKEMLNNIVEEKTEFADYMVIALLSARKKIESYSKSKY